MPGSSDGAEREDVGTVVLARVARGRLVQAHGRPNAPDLVGGDGRTDARAVDDDACVGFLTRNGQAHGCRDIGIVHRVGTVGAHVGDRQPAAPQVLNREPA